LATILVSNNFINIAIIILANLVLTPLLPDSRFEAWATSLQNGWPLLERIIAPEILATTLNILILTVGVTFLLVLFGEVSPKVYAKINNLHLARLMSAPLTILMRFFHPINVVLVQMTSLIEKKLDRNGSGSGGPSREEIGEAIELTVSKEEDTEQEVDILKSIVKFGEVSVKQIMRSRVDVVAVDYRIDYGELLTIVRESGYSRIPVYEDEFDNVKGILYIKDLLGHLQEDPDFHWQDLIRTHVLYAPEAKKIDDLLREFQSKRMHMAIVVDEYGGSSGIVTLEDIMEEIIGEIKDEFDDPLEVEYQKLDDLHYLFEGKTLINDFCRVIGIDTSLFEGIRGEADSLAGLMLEHFGSLPPVDAETQYDGFAFKAVSVNKRRIEKILVTIPENLKYYEKD
jgi:gliding motility-associated protein GldE